jgi:hypothetical protein
MRKKQPPLKKTKRQVIKFYHKNNHHFTGYLVKETPDFYTIELTSDVAGLNAIWSSGEVVTWSKALTTIISPKK